MSHSRSIQRRSPRRTTQLADLSRVLRQAAIGATLKADDSPPLRVSPAATPSAPAQLAQSAAAPQRAALTRTYEHYLRTYRSAAARQALHGIEPNDDMLAMLERQLRATARRCADWDTATPAQRQFFFEQIAIGGVRMAAALGRTDAAAREQTRRAARQYLQQVLGLDPDLLTLGPSGLVARAHDAALNAQAA
jgi:hypothetical protein